MTADIRLDPKHDLDLNFDPDLDLDIFLTFVWPTSTCRGRWGWVQWWPQQLQRRQQPQPIPPHPLDIVVRSSFLVKGTVYSQLQSYRGAHSHSQHLPIHLTLRSVVVSWLKGQLFTTTIVQKRPQPQPAPPRPLDIAVRSSFLVKGTVIHNNNCTEAPQPKLTPPRPLDIAVRSSFLVKGTVIHNNICTEAPTATANTSPSTWHCGP